MKREAYIMTGRGLAVFPVRPDDKRPAVDGWQEKATSDWEEVFARWPSDEINVGVKCGDGLVVIDADKAKGGLEALASLGPLPRTFTVRTGGGGLHLYFQAAPGSRFANSVSKLAAGVDVRADGGYVVGPGSIVAGNTYRIEDDAPIAPLPDHVAERLRQARERVTEPGSHVGVLDTPAAIEVARAWLLEAPPAIEGEGGDARTYATACRVLDFGVSPETAAELMAEEWNERCSPPWDLEDLERKVSHAVKYRQDPIGRDNPDFHFVDIEPLPRPGFASKVRKFDLTPEKVLTLPPRPWLAKKRLMRGKVTVIVAPGGSGKSLLTLQWASALALGKGDFCSLDIVGGPCGVLLVNNEDEDAELDLRSAAIFEYFGLDYLEARKRLDIYSGVQETFKIALRAQRGGKLVPSPEFDELVTYVVERNISCVIFDPLVSLHEADENSNSEMDSVMRLLTRLAAATHCAVAVIHHTNKPPAASTESYAGNGNVGRGASAVRDASRVQLTLFGMSKDDAERFGIPEKERRYYVRLDDAKENLYLGGDADWFKKVSVPIGTGAESMGVLVPVTLKISAEVEALREKALTAIREASTAGKPICCADQGPHAGHVALAEKLGVERGAAKAALVALFKMGSIKQCKDLKGRATGGVWEPATKDGSDA